MPIRPLGVLLFSFVVIPSLAQADELDPLLQAIQAQPDQAKPYEDYAQAAIAKGRLDDAIAKLKIGVARVPDFARGYYLLGSAYRKQAAWADAATFYRCYIVLRPSELDSYWGLGKALVGLGDKAGAIDVFKKYISLEKSPQRQKYVEDARVELAKLEPPAADPAKLREEANRLKAEKKFEEAAQAYQRALAVDPNNLELYNNLGNVYFMLKRYADAAQAFKEAVTRKPDFHDGWYNLAFALKKAARYGEAVEAYRRYLTMRPNDTDAYYGLGGSLKQTGDLAGAAQAFSKYISLEKRPDQQKYVEKAKKELADIEAQQAPSFPTPSTRLEDK